MSRDPSEQRVVSPGAAVLWASAFVITALIIGRAGQTSHSAAYADTVASVGDYTVMTALVGNLEEVLIVVDNRDENIYTYVTSGKNLELQDFRGVKEMFELAQNRGNPKR